MRRTAKQTQRGQKSLLREFAVLGGVIHTFYSVELHRFSVEWTAIDYHCASYRRLHQQPKPPSLL